jgi:hypothetical protein
MNIQQAQADGLSADEDASAYAETDACRPCEHAGCTAFGVGVYLHGGDPEPESWFCFTHMTDEGFCWGCLLFSAGEEAFDFSKSGLCGECQANPDITGEEDEWDEDDYPDDDPDFDPMFLL